MAHEWHYSKDGTQHGPVSSSDLEALAVSGELSPSDLIWKEGMADWKSAGKFKGLFPNDDGNGKASLSASNEVTPSAKSDAPTIRSLPDNFMSAALRVLFKPAFVFLSMFMCFPIGLILVWKNPAWTTFRKLRWTAGFCAVAFAFVYLGIHIRHEATVSLASANQLWSAGDKDMAVPKYKRAISLALSVVPENERPVVFKRVIEHDAEHGNQASAKELIEKALNQHIPLNLDAPQAKEIMAAVQAERQRIRDEAEAKERQAALAAQTAKAEQVKAKPTQDEGKKSDSPQTSNSNRLPTIDLIDAFANEASGNKKYGGKTLEVVGDVVSVEQKWPSQSARAKQFCVVLGGAPGPRGYTTWVECFFDSPKAVESVVPGGDLVVRGKVQERFGAAVRMVNCEIKSE